jgi:hypothetical protein
MFPTLHPLTPSPPPNQCHYHKNANYAATYCRFLQFQATSTTLSMEEHAIAFSNSSPYPDPYSQLEIIPLPNPNIEDPSLLLRLNKIICTLQISFLLIIVK